MEIEKTAEKRQEKDNALTKGKKKQTSLPDAWKLLVKDYKMQALIGSGSFGQVVKARHLKTGKTVAIKRIEDIFQNIYEGIKIVREVQIMRHLTQMKNNLYTVQLYDIIPDEEMNSIFLVMEYVQSDLKKVLNNTENSMLDQQHILVMVYKLLCSLQFLHSANIMHRDLKPANVLVDEECNIKICDFGLSRSQNLEKVVFEKSQEMSSKRKISRNLTETRKSRNKQERQLSNHACSRWYRPPEIILLEKQYGEKVDIWSAGCIVSELVYCQSDYVQMGANFQDRHLFKGDSCFPLSPVQAESTKISKDDQMKVILEILGKQTEDDFSFISDKKALPYARNQNGNDQKLDLKKEFPSTNHSIVHILEDMIKFNPYFRKSATQLLEDSIFDVCRQEYKDFENIAPYKIELITDEPGSFDYEECTSTQMDIQKLKAALQEEIQQIKSMELLR